jgi:uncharacterized membrane protein
MQISISYKVGVKMKKDLDRDLKYGRIFEIDLFRVVAISLMITFHLVYDLTEFTNVEISFSSPLWSFIGEAAAVTFIFVAGISSGFSRNSIKRGIKVFCFGLIITIATYFFDNIEYIRFGILHFLGVAMIIFPLLNKLKKWQLLTLGVISFIIGNMVANITVHTHLLIPLGFMYSNFVTMDYYPLFPYIAVFIFGVFIFKSYYYKGISLLNTNYNSKIIKCISKNSLKIYLIHQPILLAIIFICKFLKLL